MPNAKCPQAPCPRCGGSWWRNWWRGETYYSCMWCGHVDEAVHHDPELEAALRAEAGKSKGSHLLLGLAPPGRERELRYLVGAAGRQVAELRSLG